MYNWAGKFSIFIIFFAFKCLSCAQTSEVVVDRDTQWSTFKDEVRQQIRRDKINGVSYIISGTIAFGGGLVGSGISDDEIEKGIYTVFQTIGVASAGYGLYVWSIGGIERELYSILGNAHGLSDIEKTMILRSYYRHKVQKEKKEKWIKAITHGLIGGLNIYSATQQKDDSIKTALFFVGGINMLATITYTF